MDEERADAGAAAAIGGALRDLESNAPAGEVMARLRAIETGVPVRSALRARYLRARAMAENRLGFPTEAQGDLIEARRLLDDAPDDGELIEVLRATAVVSAWRGDGREAALALLAAAAKAASTGRTAALAMAFIEGGRLQLEIGRPRDAKLLLASGLALAGDLPVQERRRAIISLAQALIEAGDLDGARQELAGIAIADASARTRFLVALETARLEARADHLPDARDALARAVALLPADMDTFERVELAQVEAEIALREGDAATADRLLQGVIARASDDDLAGREIAARLLRARALGALGRGEEAAAVLAAGLRRALARGLNGHADDLRAGIAARGGAEGAWLQTLRTADRESAGTEARFVRRRPLGSGGYGSVTRAYDIELGVEVALKRFKLGDLHDTAERLRLIESARAEVAAASRIEHPALARVNGLVAEPDGDLLLVQELVDGPSLRAGLAGPMAPARVAELLSRVAYALSALHAAGIVHADVKPDNIVLRGGRAPVLVDFGNAYIPGGTLRHGAGTRDYMAPEHLAGRPPGPPADLYALGVTAFELLMGERPGPASRGLLARLLSPFRERQTRGRLTAAGVPTGLAGLIAALMAPAARRRPASAAEAGAAFATVAAG